MRQPCSECPFRIDGIRHLGDRADEIVNGLSHGQRFQCHGTLPIGVDGLGSHQGSACVGALKYLVELPGVLSFDEFLTEQHVIE